MHVDYYTMDGGRFYQEDMPKEQYEAISIGDIITVYDKEYAVDKKVGYRFVGLYLREPKILECSRRGDAHFSAFCAVVEVYGESNSIEGHYQLSKRFRDSQDPDILIAPTNIKDFKGMKPDCFSVGGFVYPLEMLSMWYKLLWMKYLDSHPLLVEFASHYDDFTDMFKGKYTVNCQADVIKQYIKDGKQSIVDDCLPLIWAMRDNNKKKEQSKADMAT